MEAIVFVGVLLVCVVVICLTAGNHRTWKPTVDELLEEEE